MSITLDLPQELETELSVEAARLGITLTEYVVRVLSTDRPGRNMPKTGADVVDYWRREGLIGLRPDIVDSQEHARQIRQIAERRTPG